ncbi:hypothetical protein [Streptomyces niveus]|uniref:hypothetical protein n=1 Tax=Streptomyces niveus TaxID=193462 RepID=UPI00343B29F4
MNKLKKLAGIDLFLVVELVVTAGALSVVVATVAPNVGELLGLTGTFGLIVGGFVAVLLDMVWVGAMRSVDVGIKARRWVTVALMGGLSVIAAGGSVVLMNVLGHASVLSFLPGLALAVTAVRVVHANTSVSPDTAEDIAQERAAEVNADAASRSAIRLATARREREAAEEVAAAAAESNRLLALAEEAVRQKTTQNDRYAELNRRIRESEEKHGNAEAAFHEWVASVPLSVRLTPPRLGPSEPVSPAMTASEDGKDPFNLRELTAPSSEPLSTWTSQVSAATASTPLTVHADVDASGRLSTEDANRVIEECWRKGLSTREAAGPSTRSHETVNRRYKALEAQYGPQPMKGQTEIEDAA